MVVFLGGFPPLGNRRLVALRRSRGGKGSDKIRDNSPLGRFELAIPNQIDSNFARKKGTIVVCQELRLVLHHFTQYPTGQRDLKQRDDKEKFDDTLSNERSHFDFDKEKEQ